jgi:hypothetical protein
MCLNLKDNKLVTLAIYEQLSVLLYFLSYLIICNILLYDARVAI